MLTIRTAGEEDAQTVARLLTALNEAVGADGLPPPEDQLPENVLVSPGQARPRLSSAAAETGLLAEEDGTPLGLAALRVVPHLGQDAPNAEVTQLYVARGYRRRGIARALVSRAEEMARASGCTSLRVLAFHNNAEAKAFYRSLGYEPLYVGFEKFLTSHRAQG
jgi:ribosomal protein S18 acetylase RimI-like enzyme